MVNVNKKYLEEKLKSSIWRDFIRAIKKARTEKDIKETVGKLFTPTELIMIEKRLAIISFLKQGISHREIGRILDVSPATVSFVRNGFSGPKKPRQKKGWKHQMLERLDVKRPSHSKFPTYRGKGRWRFLHSF